MATDIKKLFEALTQHQAYLYRASSKTVNELLALFNDDTSKMLSKLRDLLDELNESEKVALAGGKYTTSNLREIRDLIAQWFASVNLALPEAFAVSATALAVYEANYVAKLYGAKINKPDGEKLFLSAKKVPLAGGALVDDLLSRIAESARQKVEYAIRDGINSGKTNQEIVQRIRGTKRLNYEDGILNGTKTDIERTVRTVRSHVANQAYLNSFNQIGFEYVRFVSVLDGRTSKLCASLDGSVWEINDPAKRVPPLHPNCRSILVPVEKDGQLVGERPFVMDERRVKDIPKEERSQLIGQLDANTTFKEFFKKTDDFFQREWLGPKRFKLYKDGKFDFEKFFDPEGRFYSLDDLRKLDEKAFKVGSVIFLMLYFLKHQNLYNMKTIAFVCLTLISITCLAEPSQKYLKEYDRLSEALESAMANAYSFDPTTGQVKQATQDLEAKNNLCRAAQAKLNLTTFLKDNLEESKELYKSIDGAETLDKNYLSGQQQEQQNLVSNLKKDLVGTGFNCE